jgi:hypothetical protein
MLSYSPEDCKMKNELRKNSTGGPPIQYPDLGGAMVPMTVHLPPDVLAWCKKHPRGAGERVRTIVVGAYKKNHAR